MFEPRYGASKWAIQSFMKPDRFDIVVGTVTKQDVARFIGYMECIDALREWVQSERFFRDKEELLELLRSYEKTARDTLSGND